MPAVNAANLPFPLETDPVAHMAQIVQMLADKVAQRVQSGTVNVTLSAAASGSATVTFPTPYSTPPIVTATPVGASTMVVGVSTTATAATITVRHYEGSATTATITVGWIACGKPTA